MEEIQIISINDIKKDLFCKACVSTKLICIDGADLIYKCRTCGLLYKYNKVQPKPKLKIDSELDNTRKSFFMALDGKIKKEPDPKDNYKLVEEKDIKL